MGNLGNNNRRANSRVVSAKETRRIGIIQFQSIGGSIGAGSGNLVSVPYVHAKIEGALDRNYETHYFNADSLDLRDAQGIDEFIESVDQLVLLNPYHVLPSRPVPPLFIFTMGSPPKGAGFLAMRKSQFSTQDTLAVSCSADVDLMKLFLASPDEMGLALIPFGFDSSVFHSNNRAQSRRIVREKLSVPMDAKVVLYAGRINHEKDPHNALRVFSAAVEAVPHSNAYMVLVGAPDIRYSESWLPDPADSLVQLVSELGIEDRVRILSEVTDRNDLAELMRASDMGINLTTFGNENFGLSVVEMMTSGLPVIGSDFGGLRDTIPHGSGGSRVPTIATNGGVRVAAPDGVRALRQLLGDQALLERHIQGAISYANQFDIRRLDSRLGEALDHAYERARSIEAAGEGQVPKLNANWESTVKENVIAMDDPVLRLDHKHRQRTPQFFTTLSGVYATTGPEIDWRPDIQFGLAFPCQVGSDGKLVVLEKRFVAHPDYADLHISVDQRSVLSMISTSVETDNYPSLIELKESIGDSAAQAVKELVQLGIIVPVGLQPRQSNNFAE